MKYDDNKPQYNLIPIDATREVAEVLGFGANKYGPNNWRDDGNVTEWSRTYASIQRHLNAFWNGENLDPESGLSHLAHANTQLMILMTHMSDGHLHMDDRYKVPNKQNNSVSTDPHSPKVGWNIADIKDVRDLTGGSV
jgi:hypothetical protein|tara:strand:+ start:762 stop:1175 length:414 start_codon:yes stop_codon:yes gene_type:complete